MLPGPPTASAQPISAHGPWARPLGHPSCELEGRARGRGRGRAQGCDVWSVAGGWAGKAPEPPPRQAQLWVRGG